MVQNNFNTPPIAIWLYITAAMVFFMALIGAITRLTESGLSMAEWRPLIGALPPLSETEWQRVVKTLKSDVQSWEVWGLYYSHVWTELMVDMVCRNCVG